MGKIRSCDKANTGIPWAYTAPKKSPADAVMTSSASRFLGKLASRCRYYALHNCAGDSAHPSATPRLSDKPLFSELKCVTKVRFSAVHAKLGTPRAFRGTMGILWRLLEPERGQAKMRNSDSELQPVLPPPPLSYSHSLRSFLRPTDGRPPAV